MNECLKQHLHDIIFADGTPIKCCRPDALPLSYMFWTRTMLSTSIKRKFTESQCIFAAELVAGIVTLDIFDNRANPNYRVIALDPTLVSSCTVTDVASTLYARDSRSDDDSAVGRYGLPTRVLVSPHFLTTVLGSWRSTTSSSMRVHVNALAESLKYHTGLATAIVRAGPTFIEHDLPVCDQLIDR